MGRRALRKIDPLLDLSAHLHKADDLPCPWDPSQFFVQTAPLEVEVGSGKGLFLQRAASQTPQHNFLGIEVSLKYARFAAARLAQQKITNAVAVHGDALRLFRELVPDGTLAAVHVYFPDPWWKKRHRRRRVLTEGFLSDVTRTLQPRGQLHFWTDVKEYFDATLALIAEQTPLSGPHAVAERPAQHDLDYHTHFERRTRLNDDSVYRAEFTKSLS
ncbi:MAG: tRNA (guanosine(46)-N7)-methyltransferase TrmB [Pirellulales bacterium]|nr:tRNA (guanosine(46)-N7)-methyltransferase TrmB [Pirellulales bacterium]